MKGIQVVVMAIGLMMTTHGARADLPVKSVRTLDVAKKVGTALVFEDQVREGRVAALALPGATPLQGGIPIIYKGKVIGAIGVSVNTPQEDEDIAKVGAASAAPAIAESRAK